MSPRGSNFQAFHSHDTRSTPLALLSIRTRPTRNLSSRTLSRSEERKSLSFFLALSIELRDSTENRRGIFRGERRWTTFNIYRWVFNFIFYFFLIFFFFNSALRRKLFGKIARCRCEVCHILSFSSFIFAREIISENCSRCIYCDS